jgi:hypothetical protein
VDDVRAPLQPCTKPAGLAALVWRFVLTTGTGSIFGFLVARQAYQSALLAPLFIVLSFGWGLAVFLIVQSAMYAWNGRHQMPASRCSAHGPAAGRLRRRVAVPGGGVPRHQPVLRTPGHGLRGLHPARRWRLPAAVLGRLCAARLGAAAGAAVPPAAGRRARHAGGVVLVVLGAFAWLFVFIVGGQAFPLEIFPGHEVRSSAFGDGAVAAYVPRWPEWLLGLGGAGCGLRADDHRRARARLHAAGRLRRRQGNARR